MVNFLAPFVLPSAWPPSGYCAWDNPDPGGHPHPTLISGTATAPVDGPDADGNPDTITCSVNLGDPTAGGAPPLPAEAALRLRGADVCGIGSIQERLDWAIIDTYPSFSGGFTSIEGTILPGDERLDLRQFHPTLFPVHQYPLGPCPGVMQPLLERHLVNAIEDERK